MQEYQVKVFTKEETIIPKTEWLQNGKLHRLDGPAIEWANGDKMWWINGKLHRLDGPAIEWANGDKFWCINGQRHNLDGPAIELADGTKSWYIEGKRYTEEEFNQKTKENTQPTCTAKTVLIDGIEYELIKK